MSLSRHVFFVDVDDAFILLIQFLHQRPDLPYHAITVILIIRIPDFKIKNQLLFLRPVDHTEIVEGKLRIENGNYVY